MDLSGKKVSVLGAAKSGLAAVRLLCRQGAQVSISEQGGMEKFPADFLAWAEQQGVRVEVGGHSDGFLSGSDLIVCSPGVRYDAPPLLWAREQNIKIWGEIELAFRFCPKPVIAVTGSNGKTTTVTLITEVLTAAGLRATLCGNVGIPFSDCVMDLAATDFVVLEVSSFQLETIERFRPFIGVWLNFSQNHLDRHKDLDEYFTAKQRLFENQTARDFAVLNYGCQKLRLLAESLPAEVVFFDHSGKPEEEKVSNPNWKAVLAVSRILDIPEEVALNVFRSFPGVEHRLEFVRNWHGVEFVNDSKATTVEAGRWALESIDKPIILLCGGRDKNLDYSVLSELVRKKVKKMIAFGEAKEKFFQTFEAVVNLERTATLRDAVLCAQEAAAEGDCILLSPMCASFDMFKNFEERGTVFKQIVHEIE